MKEGLATLFGLVGFILFLGMFIKIVEDGAKSLSHDDWYYGVGLSLLLMFIAWFIYP